MKVRQAVIWALTVFALSAAAGTAGATVEMVKVYKKAFPGEKAPKCVVCHVNEKPKKDVGNTELNEYGKKVVAVKETVDEASFQAVGKGQA